MLKSPIAINTKRIIQERGYKQKSIAKQLGYNEKVFSNLLHGRRVMTDADIIAIANGLQVTPNELFGYN